MIEFSGYDGACFLVTDFCMLAIFVNQRSQLHRAVRNIKSDGTEPAAKLAADLVFQYIDAFAGQRADPDGIRERVQRFRQCRVALVQDFDERFMIRAEPGQSVPYDTALRQRVRVGGVGADLH